MRILDKGELVLRDYMASDLAVVEAARVSNGITEDASRGEEKDAKLIKYLISHRHGTPFEHTAFKFFVKAPLFVVREWQRHRIGSFNEVSGRYVEFEPEFYEPEKFRIPAITNKQGSIFPESSPHEGMRLDAWHYWAEQAVKEFNIAAYSQYMELIRGGVAKEMARGVLPLSLYTSFYWTVNARSLMNFISLRSAEDAQYEIRQYGIALKNIFREKMPLTYAAWEANEFIAP